jgi:hypothetical protein
MAEFERRQWRIKETQIQAMPLSAFEAGMYRYIGLAAMGKCPEGIEGLK